MPVLRTTPPPAAIRAVYAATVAELCRHGVARDRCTDHDPRRTPAPTEREHEHG